MAWGDFFGASWDDPKTMMMMQAAAGLLAGNPVGQNRATLGQSLSRGLLGGMQGYQAGLQAKRQGEQLELQKREADLREKQLQSELDLKRQEQARAQQQLMLRGALPGLLGGQGMTGPQAMALGATQGSVGPTQANAARMAPSPGGLSQQFLQAALSSGMKPEEIKTLAGAQQWNTPKVSKFENVRNPDGSVSVVGFDEFGRPVQTGQTPFIKPEFMNTGGSQVAVDPTSLRTLGQWQNTMTPGEAASNQLGWANNAVSRGQLGVAQGNLAVSRDRLAFEKEQPRGQVVDTPQGLMIVDPRAAAATPVTARGGGEPVLGARGADARADRNQATFSFQNSMANLQRLLDMSKEVGNHPGLSKATGLFGAVPSVPGTAASNFEALHDTLASQVFVNVLQAMRDASKTGGAVGQVAVQEMRAMENNLAALSRKQSPAAYKAQVKKITAYADGAMKRFQEAYQRQYGSLPSEGVGGGARSNDPLGILPGDGANDPLGILR